MTGGHRPLATSVECTYFDGAGAVEGPLTWAQQFMREVVLAAGTPVANFDLFLVHDLARPLPVEAAIDLLRQFALRNPLLRTSMPATAEAALTQRVNARGTMSVPVLSAEDPFAAELRDAVPATTVDSPFRPLLVVSDDAVVRIALRLSHLITDAGGARLLADDLAALADEKPATEVSGQMSVSPLDLARFEQSAQGQAVQRDSLAHAAAVYDISPPTMFPRRRTPESPRFWFGQLRSADILVAMDTLKRDVGVTPAGILAGSLAAVTAAKAGLPSTLLFVISSNRFDLDWASYPGSLSQEAILHLPLEPTLRDTMRAATTGTMRSLRKARYAPAELAKVRRVAERRRGVTFDQLGTAVVLNLQPSDAVPRIRPAPTTFAWSGRTDAENLGFYVDASHTTHEFVLGVRVDTSLVAPDEAEGWLRAMEWTIVTAASRNAPVEELHAHLSG